MTDRIMTLHPQGETGVNINKQKYDVMREAILDIIRERDEITFEELMKALADWLSGKFDGAVGWYTTTVKLDLEARGEIQRVPKSSPQRLRLAK